MILLVKGRPLRSERVKKLSPLNEKHNYAKIQALLKEQNIHQKSPLGQSCTKPFNFAQLLLESFFVYFNHFFLSCEHKLGEPVFSM